MQHQPALGIDLVVDPLWCAWFSGLCDGEASFLLMFNKTNHNVEPYIQIKLREDDERMLREIQSVLKCGKLFPFRYALARARGGKDRDQIGWLVLKQSDLLHVIIPLLDRYPLKSKKRREYQLWREAVCVKHSKQPTKAKFESLMALKRELESGRRPPKTSPGEFGGA